MNKKRGPLENTRGFTLLEIILVLVFIALIAGLTTPFVMSTLERVKYQAEVREINSALRFARSEAITRKTVITFNANTRNKKYWLSSKEKKSFSDTRSLDPGFTMSYLNNNEETVDDATFAIKFYPRGNSSGGTILVEKASSKNSDAPYEIIIDPITGSSRIDQETR